jgi:hypothetical protein
MAARVEGSNGGWRLRQLFAGGRASCRELLPPAPYAVDAAPFSSGRLLAASAATLPTTLPGFDRFFLPIVCYPHSSLGGLIDLHKQFVTPKREHAPLCLGGATRPHSAVCPVNGMQTQVSCFAVRVKIIMITITHVAASTAALLAAPHRHCHYIPLN